MQLKEEQVIIPAEKITAYLLVKKEKNDKSKFLLSLGYTNENWQQLAADIKQIAIGSNLVLEKESEYGDLYSVSGDLKNKAVITIWLQHITEKVFRFITLYPKYE